METRRIAGPTPRASVARLLPRSRTVALLRTPAPYRHLVVALGFVAVSAGVLSLVPALLDRARLTEAMFAVASLRIEPSLVHAERGRWPRPDEVALPAPSPSGGNIAEHRTSTQGVAVVLLRDREPVELELRATAAPGGILRWDCYARPGVAERPLDPLSVPAACRP